MSLTICITGSVRERWLDCRNNRRGRGLQEIVKTHTSSRAFVVSALGDNELEEVELLVAENRSATGFGRVDARNARYTLHACGAHEMIRQSKQTSTAREGEMNGSLRRPRRITRSAGRYFFLHILRNWNLVVDFPLLGAFLGEGGSPPMSRGFA
jgi:hypothetical protein